MSERIKRKNDQPSNNVVEKRSRIGGGGRR